MRKRQKKSQQADENVFPAKEYNDMLNTILKAAQDEYKQITYDTPNRQQTILRNYQWLATVVLAVECSMFAHVIKSDQGFWIFPWSVSPTGFFYWWAATAAICAASVFVLGLDTLRGRGVTHFPARSYTELSKYAYGEATKTELAGTVLATMIDDLEKVIIHQREMARPIGPKLRTMSWGLLLSLLFTLLALLPNIPYAAS